MFIMRRQSSVFGDLAQQHDTSVVDEDIQAAPAPDGPVDRVVGLRFVGDISHNRDSLATAVLNTFHDCIEAISPPGAGGDICTLSGQRVGGGLANTR